jgi:cytochrome c553
MASNMGVVATREAVVVGVLTVVAAFALPSRFAAASPERVDQMTQTALALKAHPAHGAKVFAQHCASCHGSKAAGAANLEIPALAGQRFTYVVRQLAGMAGGERENASMHPLFAEAALREPQTWADLAAYVTRAPVPRRRSIGDGTQLATGEAIFHLQCASCHHDDARGDDDGFVPSLRNQHYTYLANQMIRLGRYDRHNADENLARFLHSFDSDEQSAVADYLARLRGPGPYAKAAGSKGIASH